MGEGSLVGMWKYDQIPSLTILSIGYLLKPKEKQKLSLKKLFDIFSKKLKLELYSSSPSHWKYNNILRFQSVESVLRGTGK